MKRVAFLVMLACTMYVGNEVRQSERFQTALDTGSKLVAVFAEDEQQAPAEAVAATELAPPVEPVTTSPSDQVPTETPTNAEIASTPTEQEQLVAAPAPAGSEGIPMQSWLLYAAMAGGLAYAGKQAWSLGTTALAKPDDFKYERFGRIKGIIPVLFRGENFDAKVQERMVATIQTGRRAVSRQTRRDIVTAKLKLMAAKMRHTAGSVTPVAVENAQQAVELAEARAVAERIAVAEWYLSQSADRFAADSSGEMGRAALRRGAYHGAVANAAKEVIGRLRPIHAAHSKMAA